jgi:hypothetical protein
VQSPRDAFLAAAGLTAHEHGHVGRREAIDEREHAHDGRARTDDREALGCRHGADRCERSRCDRRRFRRGRGRRRITACHDAFEFVRRAPHVGRHAQPVVALRTHVARPRTDGAARAAAQVVEELVETAFDVRHRPPWPRGAGSSLA